MFEAIVDNCDALTPIIITGFRLYWHREPVKGRIRGNLAAQLAPCWDAFSIKQPCKRTSGRAQSCIVRRCVSTDDDALWSSDDAAR